MASIFLPKSQLAFIEQLLDASSCANSYGFSLSKETG